ncbi:MAG: acyl-CoA dehydrogenase [Calditrichaeota bacterium]|nr:acyl-CoA dehydrogenase [Calditrichota bacterium]
MQFELTEEQKSIQEMVREFAREEIAPIVMEYDEAKRFPEQLIPKMAELGLLGIIFPEEYGGAGMGYMEYVLIVEELSAVDPSIGLTVAAHNSLGTNHIYTFGNEAQRQKYVTHLAQGKSLAAWALTEPCCGSDAAALKTTARRDGDRWILNGQKTFITNPTYSDYVVVMARTDPEKGKKGISAFVVENGTPGYTIGNPMNKLGTRASDTAELFFEDCAIPAENLIGKEGEGYKQAMQILSGGRISIAALCVGMARGAYEHTLKYTLEREAFGQKIANFQAIQFRLADMATEIEAAKLLTYQAAWLADQGKNYSLAASMAKLYASELAVRVADMAVQTFGGYGYIKEYPVEKFYRDSKIGTIGEGTSDIQRLVIARELIKQASQNL